MLAFGKFFSAGIHNQGVVQIQLARVRRNAKTRFVLAGIGNQLGKCNLAGGGIADVFAADDVGDSFGKVIDADGELISPESVAVADREIATLKLGIFAKVAEAFVVPVDYFVWNDDPKTVRFATGQHLSAAFPLINHLAGFADGVFGLQLFAAAGARVDEPFGGKLVEDFLKEIKMGTLNAFAIVPEAEPGEIFADTVDVFFAGTTLVVVLDAQVYFEIPFFCGGPHVKSGEQVPFV